MAPTSNEHSCRLQLLSWEGPRCRLGAFSGLPDPAPPDVRVLFCVRERGAERVPRDLRDVHLEPTATTDRRVHGDVPLRE